LELQAISFSGVGKLEILHWSQPGVAPPSQLENFPNIVPGSHVLQWRSLRHLTIGFVQSSCDFFYGHFSDALSKNNTLETLAIIDEIEDTEAATNATQTRFLAVLAAHRALQEYVITFTIELCTISMFFFINVFMCRNQWNGHWN
jgi:hypothetical protein